MHTSRAPRPRSSPRSPAVVALAAAALSWSAVAPSSAAPDDGPGRPRVSLLDEASLLESRRQAEAGDPAIGAALAKLREEADDALDAGPFSVTQKPFVPPSGDPHDYMSVGPYWWPDPESPDGLPYIRRDGEVNPERLEYDNRPLSRMRAAVETLALAWFLTGHEPYAEHASTLLRAWFLDEETRMNPHLDYGQAIPGRTEGRGIGIIDTMGLPPLLDAVGLLDGSSSWTEADRRGLEAWFREYLDWLRESPLGRDEARARNNHGTWYDVQASAFALFVGEEETAWKILEEAKERRIASQIEPDGRQPHELARTKSFDYSLMNLRGMFDLATLGERVGVDLWHFESADGRGIRKALDRLVPFATGEAEWTDRQIVEPDPARLAPLLLRAAKARRLDDDPARRARLLLRPDAPPTP
jgi:hypothetical protein